MSNQNQKSGTGVELKYKMSVPVNLNKEESAVAEKYLYYVCVRNVMWKAFKSLLYSALINVFMLYIVSSYYKSGINTGLQYFTAVAIFAYTGFLIGANIAGITLLSIGSSKSRLHSQLVVRKGEIHAKNLNARRARVNVVTESGEPYIADIANELTETLLDSDGLPLKLEAYILESGKHVAAYPVEEFKKATQCERENV